MSARTQQLLVAGSSQYQVSRSLRFRQGNSGKLSWTPGVAPTSATTYTQEFWVKRGKLSDSAIQVLYAADSTAYDVLSFETDDTIRWWANAATNSVKTVAAFRDPSAWYHIVVRVNTNAASGSRLFIEVNGVNQVLQAWTTEVGSAQALKIGASGKVQQIGREVGNNYNFFDGYIAGYRYIDGQALAASNFAQTDPTTNQWVPKAYSGTYGTNGFFLDFSDNSSTTNIALDRSGNSNNWTASGISVTAGITNDSLGDSPTNYGADTGLGGEVRGNYATLNSIRLSGSTLSNGNLRYVNAATEYGLASTIAVPDGMKTYCEVIPAATSSAALGHYWGVCGLGAILNVAASYNNAAVWSIVAVASKSRYAATVLSGTSAGAVANTSVMQACIDNTGASNTLVWLGIDNVWFDSTLGTTGNPSTGANPTFTITKQDLHFFFSGYQNTADVNFGQRSFSYTAPTGFKALCTQNLPALAITKPSLYMDVNLRTGTGASFNVTGKSFSPDLVWSKARSSALDHVLYDTTRGATKQIIPNTTASETTEATGLTAFNSDGFTGGALAALNTNAITYVDWMWDESVTSGLDIVSQVSPASGNVTINHSLGATPEFVILKASAGGTANWVAWINGIGTDHLQLNTTAARTASGYMVSQSSTTFVHAINLVNASNNQIAYLFKGISGFSKFGSFIGNGSADGPFIYCGFRPRWIMYKRTDSTGNWFTYDTARDTYNIVGAELYANLPDAESAGSSRLDIVSNGFKLRNAPTNVSAATYIYATFAEAPFTYARAR